MNDADSRSQIAVIGGSGFIGQRLVAKLTSAGHLVRIIDIVPPKKTPDRASYVQADVRDFDDLNAALDGCRLIYNLAAVHHDNVRPISRYHEVNVDGARVVCKAAAERSIDRIIFTSSVAIYGMQDGMPDETTPPKPFNPYGETKRLAEDVYSEWQRERPEGRSLHIVRPTVVFGPDNRGNVYNLFAQIVSRRFVMVGSGKNKKSMAYVENVAGFLHHLAEIDEAGIGIYNYCDKPDLSMNELLSIVGRALGRQPNTRLRLPYSVGIAIATAFDVAAAITGRTFPISGVRVRKFCANTVFQASRLTRTGFVPSVDLESGIMQTVAHEFTTAEQ